MDAAKQIIYDFQLNRFEVFKAQDPENEDFDVTFEIGGKKLYASKLILTSVSPTFKSMLSKRWTKENKPIKIEGYSFDDFKTFLSFIYSGECELTNDNIFSMIDLTEFYGITVFKQICENFLTTIIIIENIFQIIELVDKYSLVELKKNVNDFVSKNLSNIIKSNQIQGLQKSTLKTFIESHRKPSMQEEMFEAVFKWAENQALKQQKLENTLDLDDTIKKELSDFMSFFNFEIMNPEFLIKFVLKKSVLTRDEMSEILWKACSAVYVKLINGNGEIAKGKLLCDDLNEVVNIIQSKKNIECDTIDLDYCYWTTNCQQPSVPSKLIKNNNIEWYLVFESDGDIAVKNQSQLTESDYLLAEINAEHGFKVDLKCKIEVYRPF